MSAEIRPARESAAPLRDDWPVPWEPVRGASARWTDHLSTWALMAALAVTTRLPEALVEGLVASLAALGHRFGKRRTEAAHEFLRQALGELPRAELERRTRLAWKHLFRVTIDTERFLRVVPPEKVPDHYEIEWNDHIREVIARRGGCLLVGAHLGNWEAGMGIAPFLGLHPVYAVAKPPKNRPLSVRIQAERERRGVRVLPRKGAMRAAPRILEAGGAICLLLDQRASGRALLAPFFGRPARCDRTAGVLMKRHRVPILVGMGLPGPRRLTYRLSFPEVLWPEDWADREVGDIVTGVNQAMERLILAHPDQYVWIHDRYRDTPLELEEGVPARILRRPGPPAPGTET